MISVVMPIYKAKFLAKAIDSILAQSMTDFELIIVNDASPEDIDAIIATYNDPRIRYFKNATNIGGKDLVANWNKCITHATGEFIVLASDDDIYHSDFLLEMSRLAKRHQNIDVFHCRTCIIDENDKPIYLCQSIAEVESDIDFIFQRSINRRTQLMPDFMLRRSALQHIGGFVNYPKAWYSDEMTAYRLALGKGVACSSRVLFFWRSSGINISTRADDMPQKAEASRLYYDDMTALLASISCNNDIDAYLLGEAKARLSMTIGRQLIGDLAKAPARIARKIRKDNRYSIFFSKKLISLYHITRLRHRLKI